MAVAPSFDLGMGEWTEEAEEPSSKQPPKKKLCLSLSRGNGRGRNRGIPLQDSTNRRFAHPVDEMELQDAAKGVIPAKTDSVGRKELPILGV